MPVQKRSSKCPRCDPMPCLVHKALAKFILYRYTIKKISLAPQNESPWNYLKGYILLSTVNQQF